MYLVFLKSHPLFKNGNASLPHLKNFENTKDRVRYLFAKTDECTAEYSQPKINMLLSRGRLQGLLLPEVS